jgi:hypothetical protein
VLAAALAPSAFAGGGTSGCDAKPNSYVPQPHSNQHVYGSPIQPAILGHANPSHRKPTPRQRSAKKAKRGLS